MKPKYKVGQKVSIVNNHLSMAYPNCYLLINREIDTMSYNEEKEIPFEYKCKSTSTFNEKVIFPTVKQALKEFHELCKNKLTKGSNLDLKDYVYAVEYKHETWNKRITVHFGQILEIANVQSSLKDNYRNYMLFGRNNFEQRHIFTSIGELEKELL
jgi:hypothetical protein